MTRPSRSKSKPPVLLLRRGRGAALLCYGTGKLAAVAGIAGWWWGNRLADTPVPLNRFAAVIAWHAFGVVLSLAALRLRPEYPTLRVPRGAPAAERRKNVAHGAAVGKRASQSAAP